MTIAVLVAVGGCRPAAPVLKAGEGFLPVPGGQIWYRVVGTGTKTPLVLLHGGPGSPTHYLNSLAVLSDDRPVVFYEQLGAGRSTPLTDTTMMTIAHYVRELDSLRSALGLGEIHLLGHSWGSMLAMDYMLTKPSGVRSVIFGSSVMSAARWQRDADSLKRFLPDSMQAAITKHEAAGTTDSPEYQAATNDYYSRFVYRVASPPATGDSARSGRAVYQYMWGPSEFRATGTLKDYDRVARLKEITVPILFTAGEFDEGTPAAHAYYQSQAPGSKLVIIPGAAHATSVDQPAAFAAAIRQFLAEVEARP
ncbi:MAG: proline iminopeptidase-family hydrolase [Gemmatimonadales bacterium]